MNMRHFECFIALAEELNFRRAAERCMLTQPALSGQLKQMEQELQATLVFRTNRQVRLTPAGEIFLSKAKEILEQMRETKMLVQQTESGKVGSITIGATIPAIYIVLSDITEQMRKQLPNVEMIVREMDTSVQEEEIRNNHIDIGIGHPQNARGNRHRQNSIPYRDVKAQSTGGERHKKSAPNTRSGARDLYPLSQKTGTASIRQHHCPLSESFFQP